MQTASETFFDHRLWRPILDRENEVFFGLVPGARIGLVPHAVAHAERGPMLVWQASTSSVGGAHETFDGFASCDVDIVLVIDDEAIEKLSHSPAEDSVPELRRLVRRGNVVLYFLKCEGALIEAGFEPFLESLGLTIMGACR